MMVLDKEDGRWRAGVPTPRTPAPPAAARGNTHARTPARTRWAVPGLSGGRSAGGWGWSRGRGEDRVGLAWGDEGAPGCAAPGPGQAGPNRGRASCAPAV